MKEVKKKLSNQDFYLTLVNLLRQGNNPSKISKELSISKQRLNYYLSLLKKKGIIEKKGYGTWEVKNSLSNIPSLIHSKEIRGHAFIWVIRIPKGLESLRNKALENNIELSKGQARLIVKNHKVWIGRSSIVVYENKSFYGKNSIESRKYAVISLLEVLRALESQFNIKLSPYVFKPTKEHYGMIKNDLAVQCNRNKEKIIVNDNLEGDWLWVDNSESLGELEVGGTKAIVRSKQVQDWWNDNKKYDFKVTPTFVIENINKLTNALVQSQIQLQDYAKQNVNHLKLIKEYRKENIAWRKHFKESIIKENKTQRRLNEWN